jgi:hypothetical protein
MVVTVMFRGLTDDELSALQDHLRQLAWAYTRQTAGLGSTEPYDTALVRADRQRTADQAHDSEVGTFYQRHRKEIHLQWLRMLGHLEAELAMAADQVAMSAAAEGANFRELGDAWGISRQGARKKWERVIKDSAAPDVGDRVRLTYGDGSSCEGTWEATPAGPALRLDDGSLHEHVTGQVRRDVIERSP